MTATERAANFVIPLYLLYIFLSGFQMCSRECKRYASNLFCFSTLALTFCIFFYFCNIFKMCSRECKRYASNMFCFSALVLSQPKDLPSGNPILRDFLMRPISFSFTGNGGKFGAVFSRCLLWGIPIPLSGQALSR